MTDTTERKCRWCQKTASQIAALIEANGLKQPARIFDRADAFCPCILCKVSQTAHHSSTDATPHEQVTVHRRGVQRRHGRDNRTDE